MGLQLLSDLTTDGGKGPTYAAGNMGVVCITAHKDSLWSHEHDEQTAGLQGLLTPKHENFKRHAVLAAMALCLGRDA